MVQRDVIMSIIFPNPRRIDVRVMANWKFDVEDDDNEEANELPVDKGCDTDIKMDKRE